MKHEMCSMIILQSEKRYLGFRFAHYDDLAEYSEANGALQMVQPLLQRFD